MNLTQLNKLLDLDSLFESLDEKKNSISSKRDMDGKFHPSALGDCERKLYYAFTKTQTKQNIPPNLRRTFDHGHAVHSWIQDKLVNALQLLQEKVSVSIEVSINDTAWALDHNLAGSADALISLDDKNVRVVYELKTCGSATWQSLRGPMAKHEIQANCYAACLDADFILYDYFNKDKDTHKRFLVPASKEIQDDVSRSLYKIMLACTADDDVSASPSSWTCASCPYLWTCPSASSK